MVDGGATRRALIGLALAGGLAPDPVALGDGVRYRGYGEMTATYYDYPENFYRDRTTGPQRDQRAVLDLSRLAIEGSGAVAPGIIFEAEATVRHQGVAGEYAPQQGGPFSEEHNGSASQGAVELTKALLATRIGESVSLYGGRIPIAFGLMSFYDSPVDYLGTRPFEAEGDFLPEEWSELGVAGTLETGPVTSTLEIVSGLDSTGFSSYRFVSLGQQGRYGFVRATEPAVVLRVDDAAFGGKSGFAVYYGETSQNRPTADLVRGCDHHERIAACGYVHAPLTLAEAHAGFATERLRGSALGLWGNLRNAAAVNRANDVNRTNLPAFYTPVAERAFAFAAEVGVNVSSPGATKRCEIFGRYDRIDTMWRPVQASDVGPIDDRKAVTGGVVYRPNDGFYVKSDYSRRTFHAPGISFESALTVASGFRF
jgi:hypothetical protein